MGQLSPTNIMPSGWLTDYEAPVIEIVSYAEIWSGLAIPFVGIWPTNILLLGSIAVVSGSVTIDRNSAIRRSCSNLTLVLDSAAVGKLLPNVNSLPGPGEYFTPVAGLEIRLYKGLKGVGEAILGVFLIEQVVVTDDGNGVTMVGTLKDRGQTMARQGFQAPYSTDGTSTADTVIEKILKFCFDVSTLPFTLHFTGSVYIPSISTYAIGDDPWQACQDQAAVAGMQLYFRYDGSLVLEPVPDPSTITPCVTYTEGTSTAPTTLARTISNANVPNCICIVSQGSKVTEQVQAWWWDSVSTSATYYHDPPAGGFVPTNPQLTLPAQNPLAQYPRFIQKFQTTIIGPNTIANPNAQKEQSQAVAIAIGLTAIGSLEKDTFTIRDQPAHDVDDVVTIGRVIAGIPTNTNFVLDTVTIDLGPQNELQFAARPVL